MTESIDHNMSEDADARALREEIARLRLENWELRDAMQGIASYERSAVFLGHENHRLMDLLQRPWRLVPMSSKRFAGKVKRRIAGWRSPNR